MSFPTRTKRKSRQKCPGCHRDSLTIIRTYRINYPFGHKSKPILSQIKKEKFCSNKYCRNYQR